MKVRELREALEQANDEDEVMIHVRTYTQNYAVACCQAFAPVAYASSFDMTINLPDHMHTVSRAR